MHIYMVKHLIKDVHKITTLAYYKLYSLKEHENIKGQIKNHFPLFIHKSRKGSLGIVAHSYLRLREKEHKLKTVWETYIGPVSRINFKELEMKLPGRMHT